MGTFTKVNTLKIFFRTNKWGSVKFKWQNREWNFFLQKQNFCLPKFLEYDFYEKRLVDIEIKIFFFGTPSSVPTTPQIKSK